MKQYKITFFSIHFFKSNQMLSITKKRQIRNLIHWKLTKFITILTFVKCLQIHHSFYINRPHILSFVMRPHLHDTIHIYSDSGIINIHKYDHFIGIFAWHSVYPLSLRIDQTTHSC